jgi:hypothetical protein
MLVNFLVAGVQKGGTSSLDGWLRQHPEICMAGIKETHFFDNEAEFRSAAVSYENYHQHFHQCAAVAHYGEATPIYTYWPEAIERIHQYNPAMRLLVLLRNPVDRAWSAWNMERNRGADTTPFAVAIRNETERCRATAPLPHRVYSYVSRGMYSGQIRRVLQHFSGQVLFLKSESLFAQPEWAVGQVLQFLGARPWHINTSKIYRQGQYQHGPTTADRQYLLEQFAADISDVEQLLGWDCSDWRL